MDQTVTIERPEAIEPAAKPFPAVWPSIGWVAAFLLLQIVSGIIALVVAIMIDGNGRDPMTVMQDLKVFALPMIWSLVLSEIFLLGLLWLYLRKDGRMSAIALDRWSKMPLPKTIGAAVALIGAGLAFNLLYSVYLVPNVEVQAQMRALFAAIPDSIPNTILLFVAIAVIAPLIEELLFRGLLQKSLAHKMPVWGAITISALVFGAMHMDLYAMPPLVMMGAIFGVIYHLTGSLRVTILLHMLNNAAALSLS
jgi:membrane protease YdiL (CAAX protease family)